MIEEIGQVCGIKIFADPCGPIANWHDKDDRMQQVTKGLYALQKLLRTYRLRIANVQIERDN